MMALKRPMTATSTKGSKKSQESWGDVRMEMSCLFLSMFPEPQWRGLEPRSRKQVRLSARLVLGGPRLSLE